MIVATPTHAAAVVLEAADENLARDLGEIKYASSVTVTLGYDEKVRRSLPPGFGFLVPRGACHRILAAAFVHNKFPHRPPENRALIRCFLGGARDEQIMQASENDILQIVRGELRQILGAALNPDPLFARVYKWKSAMAQYSVGHLARLQRIEALRQKLPGLALAGNGYDGIGVRTAFAPAPRRPARSSPRWACGRQPSPPASHRGRSNLGSHHLNYLRNVSFGFSIAQNKAVGAGLIQLQLVQLLCESWGIVMKTLLTLLALVGALCFAQQDSQDMKGMNMPGHDMSKMSAQDSGEDADASMHAMNSMEGHHMDIGAHMKMTALRAPQPGDAEKAQKIVDEARGVMEKVQGLPCCAQRGLQDFPSGTTSKAVSLHQLPLRIRSKVRF